MKKVEDILNTLPKFVLTHEEKARTKSSLSAFISSHPAREISIPSPYSTFIGRFSKMRSLQVFTIVFVVFCGSISAAAQGTLPGDSLYVVKVNMNEQVSGVFAFTPQAKAKHESSLAATRLQEAAELSAAGKLTSQTRNQIEASLKVHIENVQKNVTVLEMQNDFQGAVEVNSDLVSTLHGSEKILISKSGGSNTAGSATSSISKQIAGVSERLAVLENQLEDDDEISIDAESKARVKTTQAEDMLESAEKELAALKGVLSPDALRIIAKSIRSSADYLADGHTSYKNGVYNKAFINFQTSIRFSREAIVLLDAEKSRSKKNDTKGILSNASSSSSFGSSTPLTTNNKNLIIGSTTKLLKGSTTSATTSNVSSTTLKSSSSAAQKIINTTAPTGSALVNKHLLNLGL